MGAVTTFAKSGVLYLFPPKSGPKGRQARSASDPKQQLIAFRAPHDLLAYIKSVEAQGYAKTEVVLKLCYVAMEAVQELGPLWWELEKRANQEGVPHGKALGQLAALGLRAKKP